MPSVLYHSQLSVIGFKLLVPGPPYIAATLRLQPPELLQVGKLRLAGSQQRPRRVADSGLHPATHAANALDLSAHVMSSMWRPGVCL